ncbi:tetratricopeptide repeat protein [Aquisphaera giovannonii]|uniref:Tetratricopeptide repeat protein n=1 Tax=Aquisphaera giovannonii TaxID=406548 RepID=A0A5B9VY69_9BACT|nr:tetratricopeptide repeat protein [Aquisphaera giovannonii]QEH33252.1 tetratricopeptide repeat protein [Aquisphaera giovannonii]
MTVRWKPLLILSGLFFLVAVVGVIAMAWTLVPRSAAGILKQARAESAQGRFDNAKIHFQQALQLESKNASIHEEIAAMYKDWAKAAPDRSESLRAERVVHLLNAMRLDMKALAPRLALLEAAMAQDQAGESLAYAREVLKLDPNNADANYVLAIEELDSPSLNVPELRQHIKALEAQHAPPMRVELVRARLAQVTGDETGRDEALARARKIVLGADAGPVDQLARVRLEAMQIQAARDLSGQEAPVKVLLEHVHAMVAAPDLPAGRVAKLSQVLEQTQRSLVQRSGRYRQAGAGTAVATAMADAIEGELEGIFQKVLGAAEKADLQVYFTYTDHLRFRKQRDRCLQVVDEALRLPAAAQPTNALPVMGMHTVAVEMALSKQDDPARYQKAEPHVQALLSSSETRFQGLGNLFRGAIELEQSGVASVASKGVEKPGAAESQPKLRALSLAHLKLAASQLPNLPEAQARYGVALVLNQEQGLGRQYLQNAMKMGNLDPQYQFWAAWTILQAGYPEEAAPVVEALFRALSQGAIPAEMEPTLHQMRGELYQARRAPGDLERAAREFEKAAGKGGEAAVALRQAQVDVQLGHHDRALERIDALRKQGMGGSQAENLAVLILDEQGKHDEARALLRDARTRFPKAADLAGLDAALAARDGKPAESDRILREYLAQDPDNVTLTLTRAELLADKSKLNRPKEAREILAALAERSDNSAPLVELAKIEMDQDDLEAATASVAKIRSRWKESATGDILEGQLALKRGSIPKARDHFAAALKKDPDNKIIQYWKAQLDSRSGSVAEAAKALENLVRERPSKEVDAGVSLLSAAQSSLARLDVLTGRLDDAIRRYEELKRSSESGTLSRADRWQLIAAYSAKNQWPSARRELAGMLNDAKSPPSDDERVRGALLYQEHKETGAALAQLDYVLKTNPTNAGAVVTRAYIHRDRKQSAEGAALIRKAIGLIQDRKEKPDGVFYLMLAAIEHEAPPEADAGRRAREVLEQGLAAHPDSLDLVKAKFFLMNGGGDPEGAVALLREKAKSDPKGTIRRFLVDVLQERRQYEEVERVLRELVQQSPADAELAASLVRAVVLQAADAGAAGQVDRQRSLDEKALAMIREDRKRFPDAPAFLEVECDVAARSGDFNRALAITEEIDKMAPASPAGASLRARLYARQDRPAEVVKCLAKALEKNPRQTDIRLWLGHELLKLGRGEEALTQARAALEATPDRAEAILLEARALASTGVGQSGQEAARAEAASHLEAAIATNPKFREAYLVLADIAEARGRRVEAISALRRGLEVAPDEGALLARLIQSLAGPGPGGTPPRAEDLAEARRLAAEIAGQDKVGGRILAAAVGFHKAGQLELALPLATKAAEMLDTSVAHLNLGDLVLSMAEAQLPDPARSRPLFERAVQEYDRVLKLQPWQVEAVNNKAWILHSYLGRSEPALELAQGLMKHADPAALPGEFYDTLGCIQEKLGRKIEAEQSYQSGLSRSPEHPVLNYHFGKLLAENPGRESRARGHLAKALASRDLLTPAMAKDAEVCAARLSSTPRAN